MHPYANLTKANKKRNWGVWRKRTFSCYCLHGHIAGYIIIQASFTKARRQEWEAQAYAKDVFGYLKIRTHQFMNTFLFLSTRLKFGEIICNFGIVRWNTEAQLYFWNVVKRNGVLRTLKQIHCWLYKNTLKIPKKQQNKVLNCNICEAIWAFLSKNSNNPSERNLWIFPWKRKHFTEATLLHVWLTWGNSPFFNVHQCFYLYYCSYILVW